MKDTLFAEADGDGDAPPPSSRRKPLSLSDQAAALRALRRVVSRGEKREAAQILRDVLARHPWRPKRLPKVPPAEAAEAADAAEGADRE